MLANKHEYTNINQKSQRLFFKTFVADPSQWLTGGRAVGSPLPPPPPPQKKKKKKKNNEEDLHVLKTALMLW